MATYNWATVLPYSIGSVIDQTFTDFELLVIGDGCTDESEAVVDAISDERVRWHNLAENVGHQSAANNEGLRQARASISAYIGHDDVWLPHHLELLLASIDGGADVVFSNALLPGIDGTFRLRPTPNASWPPGTWVPPTTMMHRTTLAQTVGGWRMPNETGSIDPEADLLQRMVSVVGSPVWIPRLTAVKLSAAKRENVYRDRPFHEQAAWLERIRAAHDPEAELLALSEPSEMERVRRSRSRARRVLRVVRRRVRRARRGPKRTAEERWRKNRRFKGLEESG